LLSFFMLLLLCSLLSCIQALNVKDLPKLALDPSKSIVSGISAGGAMAIQIHVAASKTFHKAAIFAAPPYYCAQGSEITALTQCMANFFGVNTRPLLQAAQRYSSSGRIDDLSNLQNAKVWLYSGLFDTVVMQPVVKSAQALYGDLGVNDISTKYDIMSEHAIITDNYGNACPFLESPYINNCNFASVSAAYSYLLGRSTNTTRNGKPQASVAQGVFHEFDQTQYDSGNSLSYSTGYYFVPDQGGKKCTDSGSPCTLVVALHGCNQGYSAVGDVFVKHSGYPVLDDAVILFPQVGTSTSNPEGCFDWWGYTSASYATKSGPQVAAILNMVQALGLNIA